MIIVIYKAQMALELAIPLFVDGDRQSGRHG